MPSFRTAFSLLELSIVLVIFGGIAAMGLVLTTSWLDQAEENTVKLDLEAIELALEAYRISSGRLPCPADITVDEGDSGYGFEVLEPGEEIGFCFGEGTMNAVDAGAGVVMGLVPAHTLGMEESAMRDQWGNLILYFVTERVTREGSFWDSPKHKNYIERNKRHVGNIMIMDGKGGFHSQNAVYALVSHGPNGHGGYRNPADRQVNNEATASEQENCDCDANGVDIGVNHLLSIKNLDEIFDDEIAFKERQTMF